MTDFTDHVRALAREEEAGPERQAVLEAIIEGDAVTPAAEQRLRKMLDEGVAPHLVLEASWSERRRAAAPSLPPAA